MEKTFEKLRALTNQFFALHWPAQTNILHQTEWKEWNFKETIPNTTYPGCYAILDKVGKVLYIGVGAGKGSGLYKGYGLGNRLSQYWQKASKDNKSGNKYELKPDWTNRGAEKLVTIGIDHSFGYLAYALEVFLIRALSPEINVTNA